MFESIFTTTADNTIHIGFAMLSVGTAIILGLIIGIVYMYLCKKEGYGKNFIIGLVIPLSQRYNPLHQKKKGGAI